MTLQRVCDALGVSRDGAKTLYVALLNGSGIQPKGWAKEWGATPMTPTLRKELREFKLCCTRVSAAVLEHPIIGRSTLPPRFRLTTQCGSAVAPGWGILDPKTHSTHNVSATQWSYLMQRRELLLLITGMLIAEAASTHTQSTKVKVVSPQFDGIMVEVNSVRDDMKMSREDYTETLRNITMVASWVLPLVLAQGGYYGPQDLERFYAPFQWKGNTESERSVSTTPVERDGWNGANCLMKAKSLPLPPLYTAVLNLEQKHAGEKARADREEARADASDARIKELEAALATTMKLLPVAVSGEP